MPKKWWKNPIQRIIVGKKISESLKGKKKNRQVIVKKKVVIEPKEYSTMQKVYRAIKSKEYKDIVEIGGNCVCCGDWTKKILRLNSIEQIIESDPDFVVEDFFEEDNIVRCCDDCYHKRRRAFIKELMLLK